MAVSDRFVLTSVCANDTTPVWLQVLDRRAGGDQQPEQSTDIRNMDFGAPRLWTSYCDDKVNFAPRADLPGPSIARARLSFAVVTECYHRHLMGCSRTRWRAPSTRAQAGTARSSRHAASAGHLSGGCQCDRDPRLGATRAFYMFQTDMKSPETCRHFDVQRQIGKLASVSAGYVHTSGKNFRSC